MVSLKISRQAAGLLVAGLVSVCSAGVVTQDWPQFRGVNQDGIASDATWNPHLLSPSPKVLWKASVGEGYSSVSVVGDRVFTAGNRNGKDTIYALSLKTGATVWEYSYSCAGGSYPGPRATPATDGVLVYAFSREGLVICLDAATGALKWEKNLAGEFKAESPRWGFSASPVIYKDKLLLNAGSYGVVLDRATGAKVWASPAGTCGYASPVVFSVGQADALAIFGEKALITVDLATGRKLGDFAWETAYDINAADPIVHNGQIFMSSGYGKGCALLDVRGGAPKSVWVNSELRCQFSSSVLLNGHLYGFDGNAGNGVLKCLDLATGSQKWEERIGFGSLMAASDNLVAINERGDLFVIKANPARYELVVSAKQVLEKTCWTQPVLCRGVLICRNDKGKMVALDVSK